MAEGPGGVQPEEKDRGTWFSCGLGSTELTVGLDDLRGLLQPKRFYDSIKITAIIMNTYILYFNANL